MRGTEAKGTIVRANRREVIDTAPAERPIGN